MPRTDAKSFAKGKKKGVLFDTELPNHVETQANVPNKKALLKRSETKQFKSVGVAKTKGKNKKQASTREEGDKSDSKKRPQHCVNM